jgi:superfamily II RNA helicase
MLEKRECLKRDEKGVWEITMKGVITSHIQECNELMLGELLWSQMLHGHSLHEILCLLSVFVNERENQREERYISELILPETIKSTLREMENMREEIQRDESQFQISMILDYTLYFDYIESIWRWLQGEKMDCDGNFIKMINRLNNVCENVKQILHLMGDYQLLEIMQSSQTVLIQDVTSFQSLYVQF